MKKNYLLLAIFLLLAGGTAWYVMSGKKDEKHQLGWDRLFKVPAADIQKVFIAKRSGVTSTIERDGENWKYNGQWRASKNAVENLIEAVSQLELFYVPAPAATDVLVKELAGQGIKVEVYGKGDKLLKAYYVGGVTNDGSGTAVLMEGAEQPMIVKLPLMDGQIRTRFELAGDDWRDRHLFPYPADEISSVSVEYPLQRNKGFKLNKEGGEWQAKPFYENVPAINKPISKGRVDGFLVNFETLMAETFDNDYAKKDSIRQMVPFTVISVKNKAGEERKAAFYSTYQMDTNTGERQSDVVERFFTDVNTGDWMYTQYGVFKKVFWSYDMFFDGGQK